MLYSVRLALDVRHLDALGIDNSTIASPRCNRILLVETRLKRWVRDSDIILTPTCRHSPRTTNSGPWR